MLIRTRLQFSWVTLACHLMRLQRWVGIRPVRHPRSRSCRRFDPCALGKNSSGFTCGRSLRRAPFCIMSFNFPPFFAGRVIDDFLRPPIRNGMTKKQTKRPRAGTLPHRRKSVLSSRRRDDSVEAQTEMFWTRWNVFRRALGITTGDIRSFQLYITDSGYRTVYLKDLRRTDARRPYVRGAE